MSRLFVGRVWLVILSAGQLRSPLRSPSEILHLRWNSFEDGSARSVGFGMTFWTGLHSSRLSACFCAVWCSHDRGHSVLRVSLMYKQRTLHISKKAAAVSCMSQARSNTSAFSSGRPLVSRPWFSPRSPAVREVLPSLVGWTNRVLSSSSLRSGDAGLMLCDAQASEVALDLEAEDW